MNYKLVCTDIDGTLLNKNRQLSDKTIQVFQKIAKTTPIILASSRMPKAMKHLQKELNITNHPLICYNGALVIDYTLDKPKIVLSLAIPLPVLDFILKASTDTNVHISIYRNDDWYVKELDYWANREINNTKVHPEVVNQQAEIKDWTTGPHKIMCMGDKDEIEVLYNTLAERHQDDVHIYRSKHTYLEINTKQISKASALQLLLDSKFDLLMSDVIAFGDNFNDMDLLEQAGKGVAVANAKEAVKAIADVITESNIDDGVAQILK